MDACEAQEDDEPLAFDGSVFKSAMYSEEPGMVKEVLECVTDSLADNEVCLFASMLFRGWSYYAHDVVQVWAKRWFLKLIWCVVRSITCPFCR